MIPAAEALRLPGARLSQEEQVAAAALLAQIEAHVRERMERRGVDYATSEVRGNVIAEVNQILRAAGWLPQWRAILEPSPLGGGSRHTGYALALAPGDEAYRAAAAESAV